MAAEASSVPCSQLLAQKLFSYPPACLTSYKTICNHDKEQQVFSKLESMNFFQPLSQMKTLGSWDSNTSYLAKLEHAADRFKLPKSRTPFPCKMWAGSGFSEFARSVRSTCSYWQNLALVSMDPVKSGWFENCSESFLRWLLDCKGQWPLSQEILLSAMIGRYNSEVGRAHSKDARSQECTTQGACHCWSPFCPRKCAFASL